MKKWIMLIVACLCSVGLMAQEDKKDKAPTEEKETKKVESRDRLIFEIAHDNWLNQPDSLKTRWWGRGFNMYIMYDIPLFDSDNISVAPGVGIATTNVYHNSNLILLNDSLSYFRPIADNVNFRKNKLSTTAVDVPIELRFRTNPNKFNQSFKVALGVRVGYLLDAKTKYRGDEADGTGEIFIKDKLLPNISRVRYGTSLRVGYGNFNVFAFYSLSTLFDANRGPGIHPISVGISFNSF